MPVTPELIEQIQRYYHVERWRTGTIARQLKVHHGTVERVLRQAGLPRIGLVRASRIDPYLPFIHETLKKFPTLGASRLYTMARERGYKGGPDHLRHLIANHRPRPAAEAYLRLVTLVGEQGQVDWAHFGHLQIGQAKRPLMAFVMVLSWSRRIFLRFSLDARMESFLRGHVQAFELWGGLPRVLLYDNLKSAVLERRGDAIRFSPQLLAFAGHYHFEPRPVAVARGNEKGRVERAIRYVRENFFAARSFADLADLNAQADIWCVGQADDRLCPQDKTLTVGAAFAQEQPRLLALPATINLSSKNVWWSRSARRPTCALTSTTIRCRIPRCARRSRCWLLRPRFGFLTARSLWPAMVAVTTRVNKSSLRCMSRTWLSAKHRPAHSGA